VFHVLRNPDLLDAVESLIGPEIYSNPVQHVRIKPPESVVSEEAKKKGTLLLASTWHQDASVVTSEADDTLMLTVWLPVTDATIDNGCMIVVPKNHDHGLIEHCPAVPGKSFKYLSTKLFDADRQVALPMRRGSALLMTRFTPHGSLPNKSGVIRWSMDLRYNPTGQPTGRPQFPGFVARSRRDPSSELRDAVAWRQSWLDARRRISSDPSLVPAFGRSWTGEGCA
jgi:ectoine hydroxylase-related dioxygenase (phytanoyl-CoA dioxygenase family)